MRFFLLLLALPLLATVNEPLKIGVFTGYRNDQIHWYLKTPGSDAIVTYNERLGDVQFWMNGLYLWGIHRDLAFSVRGGYSTFGQGTNNNSGWAADGEGYFGYAVNLTPNRHYKVIITPLVGYGGHWEELARDPGVVHVTWNGFFLGLYFLVQPGANINLQAGYAYNIAHEHFQAQIPGQKVKSNAQGNPGQQGWLQFDYLLPRHWRIGLGADIHYLSTRVVDASLSNSSDEKLKLRWTALSGWLQISREI